MSYFDSSRSKSAGKLIDWKKITSGLEGNLENARFRVQQYDESIFRISLTRSEKFEDFSYSVVAEPHPMTADIVESDKNLQLITNGLQLIINKDNFTLHFLTPSGIIINEDDPLGTSWNGEQVTTYKKLQAGERFIGLGEKTGHLDRRGKGYQHWNTDSYAYNTETDPLYCSTPFYIGIHHGLLYGIFFDNTFKSFFNFGASNDRFSSFSADAGEMNYYFMTGNSVKEIISHYTSLTGRMPMPPKWSIGYQQCRYSYFPDMEVRNVADTFREKDIPADVIVFDIHYMDAYKIFTWHHDHFSDPKALIAELKEKGFEVVVMCDPGIKVEEGYDTYDDGVAEDVFIKYPDGSYYTGQVWPGWCHFPDFTSAKTREWWKEKFQNYVDLGIQGFWNDMNEPATWGNQIPENLEIEFEGNKATMRRGRNIYGLQMSRATYEGTKSLLKGSRPFNLTRSAFSGIQRYAAVWTGDNIATDEHMMLGVRLLNSMGITGMAFCGYDAGGFVGDANPKLFGRWISIAAFSPFFRGHSMVNSRDAEPWSFGEEAEEIARNYIKLRYKLMPYLYSAFHEASISGMPINRSLAIDYPHDDKVYNKTYEHQYFFGSALLVAPVESYKELTKVYLPKGKWYDLFNDEIHQGGEIMTECPIEKLPVFVKDSSILLIDGESTSNTKQKSKTLEIHVYYGENNITYNLYQDDGTTFEYEKDSFSIQAFTFDSTKKSILVEKPVGKYVSQYTKYQVYFHGFEKLKSISINGESRTLQSTDYRFLQPLRSFDPIVITNDGYKISNLPFLSLEASNESILINW